MFIVVPSHPLLEGKSHKQHFMIFFIDMELYSLFFTSCQESAFIRNYSNKPNTRIYFHDFFTN